MKLGPILMAASIALARGLACKGSDLAAAAKFIDAVNADWIPAMQARDAARIAGPYATDAVFITGRGKVVAGRQAIADLFQKSINSLAHVSGWIHRLGLREAPGVLIEWGEASLTTQDLDGHTRTSQGTYVTVWRSKPPGGWEIVRNLSF